MSESHPADLSAISASTAKPLPPAAGSQSDVGRVALIVLLVGAGLPMLAYLLRVWPPSPRIWPIPFQGTTQQGLALLGLAFASLLLCSTHVSVWIARSAVGPARHAWIALCALLGIGLVATSRYALDFPDLFNGVWRRVLAGDGTYWGLIIDDPALFTSEPLGRWLPRMLWLLGSGIPLDGEQAVRLGSILSGVALIGVLAFYLPRIAPAMPFPAAFALIFFTPTLLIFCGYPENTPMVYTLLTAYCCSALLWLRGSRTRAPWGPTLWLMLAVGTHGSALFVYGAHLLLVLGGDLRRVPHWRDIRREQLVLLVVPGLILAAGIVAIKLFPSLQRYGTPWFSQMAGGGDHRMFINLWRASWPSQDTLLGARHVMNKAQLVAGMAPLLCLLPSMWRGLAAQPRERLFLFAALGGMLVLTIFWNADLGMPRDLDLYIIFTMPLHVLTVVWFSQAFAPALQVRLALQLAAVNLVFGVVPLVVFKWSL